MLADRNRALLKQVIDEVVGSAVWVEWPEPGRRWLAHARMRGETGLVSHLLTSPEWQEARFEESRFRVFILTTTEEGDVHDALAKLARAAVDYLAGGGQVEHQRGLLGKRSVLTLHTSDGEWRIGQRSAIVPI